MLCSASQILSVRHNYLLALGKRNRVFREQRLTQQAAGWRNAVNKFLSIIHRFVCGQSRKVNG